MPPTGHVGAVQFPLAMAPPTSLVQLPPTGDALADQLQQIVAGTSSRAALDDLQHVFSNAARLAAQTARSRQMESFRLTPFMRRVKQAVDTARRKAGAYNLMGGGPVLPHVRDWIEILSRRGLACAPTIADCAAELANDLLKLVQTDSGHVVCMCAAQFTSTCHVSPPPGRLSALWL